MRPLAGLKSAATRISIPEASRKKIRPGYVRACLDLPKYAKSLPDDFLVG